MKGTNRHKGQKWVQADAKGMSRHMWVQAGTKGKSGHKE